MTASRLATILLGLVLIAVIAPLSQFLTINTIHLDIETATPVGWAVGLIFSLILSLAVVRWISGRRWLDRRNVVLLYCMLTIAAPVMNIGLVRQVYIAMMVPVFEYMINGTNTYHTRYHAGNTRWEPLPPNAEALAWHKSYRLQQQLDDRRIRALRSGAQDTIADMLAFRADLLRRQAELELAEEARRQQEEELETFRRRVAERLPDLGVDEVDRTSRLVTRDEWTLQAAEGLGLTEAVLETLLQDAQEKSRAALERLSRVLVHFGEEYASQTTDRMRSMRVNDFSAYQRVLRDRNRQDIEMLTLLERRIALLDATLGEWADAATEFEDPQALAVREVVIEQYGQDAGARPDVELVQRLREDMAWLSSRDDRLLREELTNVYKVRFGLLAPDSEELREHHRGRFEAISRQAYDEVRASMVLRMSTRERGFILAPRAERRDGQPNQNMRSLQVSVWSEPHERDEARRLGFFDRVFNAVLPEIPWKVWAGPLVRWFLLLTVMFLTLMCLAEWLRRKWIERENLAFPLVEVADHIIRHDMELETAEDIHRPRWRKGMFNWVFLCGMLIGFSWIFFEALHHHQMMEAQFTVAFNVSENFFTTGAFREMDKVFLVLSPIVIGIAFLVSLEISFSIWVLFCLYQVALLIIRQAAPETLFVERSYLGYGGGRFFPFHMEQLLGACVALSVLSLIKTIRSKAPTTNPKLGSYVSPGLTRLGLGLLPVIIVLLLYDFGITNVIFLILVGALFFAQILAMARVRAETGLHTTHVFYDYFKLPMLLGMTGWLGSRAFALFTTIAILPLTLLGRLLPQQLENIELARRHELNYRTLAVATLLSFLVALAVGMFSFIVLAYFFGREFYTAEGVGAINSYGALAYTLWVSHFLGEPGLDSFTSPIGIRIGAMMVGFGVYAGLSLLRSRFLGFPLHPIGYFLILASIWFPHISPYNKHDPLIGTEGSFLWGSVFVAWICKKLIIKYGGMNTYKSAKPLFIGMVVGAVFCVFAFNMTDLLLSLYVEAVGTDEVGDAINRFVDVPAYSPKVY
ncbi:MAG: hypothetical protein JJU36_11255 [Phycisphaeraceae bacterium]|nr:hypothetical protein [Phycisphaeraceae bacterium]